MRALTWTQKAGASRGTLLTRWGAQSAPKLWALGWPHDPRHAPGQLCPEHAHALRRPSAIPPPRLPEAALSHLSGAQGQAWRSPRVRPDSQAIVSHDHPTPHAEPHS